MEKMLRDSFFYRSARLCWHNCYYVINLLDCWDEQPQTLKGLLFYGPKNGYRGIP